MENENECIPYYLSCEIKLLCNSYFFRFVLIRFFKLSFGFRLCSRCNETTCCLRLKEEKNMLSDL